LLSDHFALIFDPLGLCYSIFGSLTKLMMEGKMEARNQFDVLAHEESPLDHAVAQREKTVFQWWMRR
jgi:hypothetical protein